jgi:hypothetical protein
MAESSPLDRGMISRWLADLATIRRPLHAWFWWILWALMFNSAGVVITMLYAPLPPTVHPDIELAKDQLTIERRSDGADVIRLPLRIPSPPKAEVEIFWRVGDGPRRSTVLQKGSEQDWLEIKVFDPDLPTNGDVTVRLHAALGGNLGKRTSMTLVIRPPPPPPPLPETIVAFPEAALQLAAGAKFNGVTLQLVRGSPTGKIKYHINCLGNKSAAEDHSIDLTKGAVIPAEAIPSPKPGETYVIQLVEVGQVKVGRQGTLTVTFGIPASLPFIKSVVASPAFVPVEAKTCAIVVHLKGKAETTEFLRITTGGAGADYVDRADLKTSDGVQVEVTAGVSQVTFNIPLKSRLAGEGASRLQATVHVPKSLRDTDTPGENVTVEFVLARPTQVIPPTSQAEIRIDVGKDNVLDRIAGTIGTVTITRDGSTGPLNVLFTTSRNKAVPGSDFRIMTGAGVEYNPQENLGSIKFLEKQNTVTLKIESLAPLKGSELADDLEVSFSFQKPSGHELRGVVDPKFVLRCPGRDGSVLVLILATVELKEDATFKAQVEKALTVLTADKQTGREKWLGRSAWVVSKRNGKAIPERIADAALSVPAEGMCDDKKVSTQFADAIEVGLEARTYLINQIAATDRAVRTVLIWPRQISPAGIDHWNPDGIGPSNPRAASLPPSGVGTVFLGITAKVVDGDAVLLATYGVNSPNKAFSERVKTAQVDRPADLTEAVNRLIDAMSK